MKAAILAFVLTMFLVGMANLIPQMIIWFKAGMLPPTNLILFTVLLVIFTIIFVVRVVQDPNL